MRFYSERSVVSCSCSRRKDPYISIGLFGSFQKLFFGRDVLPARCSQLSSIPSNINLLHRWLVAHDQIDQARAVLQSTRDPNAYEEELQGIIDAIEYEKVHMSGFSYKQFIFDPSTRWRFFLAVVINFGQQATGKALFTLRKWRLTGLCG